MYEFTQLDGQSHALEHRGLDRCPDRGIDNFRKYVSIGHSAFKKIKKVINENYTIFNL